MDGHDGHRQNSAMARYTFSALNVSTRPSYLVVWDLQWRILECCHIPPRADLYAAMGAAIERLAHEGWQAEGDFAYGFVFIRNGHDRRLLMLTPRDPYDSTPQSFSPFGR